MKEFTAKNRPRFFLVELNRPAYEYFVRRYVIFEVNDDGRQRSYIVVLKHEAYLDGSEFRFYPIHLN